jgi:hypothetical protein
MAKLAKLATLLLFPRSIAEQKVHAVFVCCVAKVLRFVSGMAVVLLVWMAL